MLRLKQKPALRYPEERIERVEYFWSVVQSIGNRIIRDSVLIRHFFYLWGFNKISEYFINTILHSFWGLEEAISDPTF